MNSKIEKRFILSDSTVNCYGFRLLTSGCILAEFQKNPIGYFMHERDKGVLVKWQDIKIEGDKITAAPVINMSHPRAQQTIAEINTGFLNAASVGHLVCLEATEEEKNRLPGQTKPTVTKWYPRECSLVDIPGNNNALVLYDVKGNQLSIHNLSALPSLHTGQSERDIAKKLSPDELLKEAVKQNNITTEQAALLKEQYQNDPEKLKPLLDELAKMRLRHLMSLEFRALDRSKMGEELNRKFPIGYRLKYFLEFGSDFKTNTKNRFAKPADFIDLNELIKWAVENKLIDQQTADGWVLNFGKEPDKLLKMITDIPLTRLEKLMSMTWDQLEKTEGGLNDLKELSYDYFREKFKNKYGVYPREDEK